MAFTATEVKISERIRRELLRIANGQKTERRLTERARIVLYAAENCSNSRIAERIGLHPDTCSKWRGRFAKASDHLHIVEHEAPEKLAAEITSVLSDAQRPGCPRRFNGEQIAWIMNRACTTPSLHGFQRRRWTGGMLAESAMREGIVDCISARTVQRYLKEAAIKPWRTDYWMHSPDKDENPIEFEKRVAEICGLYLCAPKLKAKGIHLVCLDEKTGMQACEDKYPRKPVQPGSCEKQEFEYKRHGTLTLIAGFEVSTGTVQAARIGKTRTETDFAAAIRKIVRTDPEAEWIFIADGLNIHKSATLVEFVAAECGLNVDLGEKGKKGPLKSMETRGEFLQTAGHRIRFVYTPRHCSWVNQVEIWFGTLTKQLLNHCSYVSTRSLDASIRRYIQQYNVTAKPYAWTYTGVPLSA